MTPDALTPWKVGLDRVGAAWRVRSEVIEAMTSS